MKKNSIRIITIIFLCVVPVWMMLCKDVMFSQKENRNLASFPKLTLTTLVNGEFMDDFETYLADQFPVRDWCVSLKTAVLRVTGKRLINDVYIAKDNYLIAKESTVRDGQLSEMTDTLNYFAGQLEDVRVNLMLIPNASLVYEDKLPYGAESDEEETINTVKNQISDKVNYVDVYNTLMEHKSEGLYYKTDHHWTSKGAYYSFLEYASANGITPVDYEFYPVTGSFQGTQASNCGVYNTFETISLCIPENSIGTYVVRYVNDDRTTTTLFDESKLNEKDKYQVFMGGNYAEVDISTTANTGKNLMIIKDSYANCFIPMLTPYYDKIIVIDPRYFYDDIYTIAQINKVNEVLFMYNVNSFVDDNSLRDIIVKEEN